MRKYAVLTAFILLITFSVFADSPLTSTGFAEAYMDNEMVAVAAESGYMDADIAGYLADPDVALDEKAAVINALSWDIDGKTNALYFVHFLYSRYLHSTMRENNADNYQLFLLSMTSEDRFCYGYLLALDDYFDVRDAEGILAGVREQLNHSFTAAIIHAVVKAQVLMDGDWCEVWMVTEDVLKDDLLERDMREPAINIIVDYMFLYADECE